LSEIRATTISDAAGTGPITLTKQSAAKAWINFNGTGTVAIQDSFNTDSLTDNGTGSYTQNFSSAMVNANYQVGGFNHASGVAYTSYTTTPATTSVRVTNGRTDNFVAIDTAVNQHSVHGDLA